MTLQYDETAGFLGLAYRLAKATGYEHLCLGLVAIRDGHQWLITNLRVQATAGDCPERPMVEAGGKVLALRKTLPFQGLESLLADLEREELGWDIGGAPLRLAPSQGAPGWHLTPQIHVQRHIEVILMRPTATLDAMRMSARREPLEAAVATATGFQYASLLRLVHHFVGVDQEHSWEPDISLRLTWPLWTVNAELRGGSGLRLEVAGLPGLDPHRFLINLEGEERDEKLDSSTVAWTNITQEGSDRTLYLGEVGATGIAPTGVNVYFEGLPEVRLRQGIQRPSAPPRLITDIYAPQWDTSRPAPIPGPSPALRLSAIGVRNYRLLRNVVLELGDIVVLVGPNQVGKTTLLESFSFLADAATGSLASRINREGTLAGLVTRGTEAETVSFSARFQTSSNGAVEYGFELEPVGSYDYIVSHEWLVEDPSGTRTPVLDSYRGEARLVGGHKLRSGDGHEVLLHRLGQEQSPSAGGMGALSAVRAALASVRVHRFSTDAMRQPTSVQPKAIIDESGRSLAAALFELSQTEQWPRFMELVRLAFPGLSDLPLSFPTERQITFSWREASGASFRASELSDGALAYLASACALLTKGASLVALDEPETHLHPEALYRLVALAGISASHQPVLLATQSDRLISFLDERPDALVILQASEAGTRLVHPDDKALAEWMREFSLDELRQELETWPADE